jgi:hypothetical protein
MTLDLSDQQVGYLMQTLAARPYGEVAELIAIIHRQAALQHQAPRAANGNGNGFDGDQQQARLQP